LAPNIVAYNAGLAFIEFGGTSTAETETDAANIASYFWLTVEWTLFCILMQLGTNLHNDYADFVKGADNDKRVGQARATQKGWLTPFQTAAASGLTLLMGLFLGMRFVGKMNLMKPTMGVIVATSIFNAFAYTGGPWPLGYIGLPNFSLGYSGLGDLFVFLYFGLAATLVPPFLYVAYNANANANANAGDDDAHDTQQQQQPQKYLYDLLWKFAPYAIQVAVLATNIIVVNNLRDRHTDVHANKRTLAVRFGATFCRVEYAINLMVAYGGVLVMGSSSSSFSTIQLLPLLSLPLAWKEWQAVSNKEGGALNQHVGGAARLQTIFCILLAISIRNGN
jgi:1,4-dihydroxy-2-naphthoate octaprenyltransferase